MTSTGRIALVLAVLLASIAAPAAAESTTLVGTQIQTDDVLMRIDLRANGTAVWTVEYRVRLDDENATAAFESIRRDVENNSTAFARPFGERMRATARSAENATGREMAIRNVTADAAHEQLPQEYGVITYRFVWEGFADADADGIRAGDAIAGLFLDRQTTLVVAWPEGYGATELSPTPADTRPAAVTWTGPLDFTGAEPLVVVERGAGERTPDGSSTPASEASTASAGGDADGVPWLPVVASLLVVAVGLLGYLVVTSRSVPIVPGLRGGDRGAERGDSEPATPAESTVGASDEDSADDPSPPPELLSNEERVLQLVRDRGGRIKQQEVARELDWTDAKTSQVARKMRDEGELDGFRLGRENVLTLPDFDPVPDDE